MIVAERYVVPFGARDAFLVVDPTSAAGSSPGLLGHNGEVDLGALPDLLARLPVLATERLLRAGRALHDWAYRNASTWALATVNTVRRNAAASQANGTIIR